jgi:hypothetical protein
MAIAHRDTTRDCAARRVVSIARRSSLARIGLALGVKIGFYMGRDTKHSKKEKEEEEEYEGRERKRTTTDPSWSQTRARERRPQRKTICP